MKSFSRGSFQFQFYDMGDVDRDCIILLHGFPGGAESWLNVAERLADNGYRVLVPFQRGFSKGTQPRLRRDYALSELDEDIRGLMDAAAIKQAHIVGHDWGGVVAWSFAWKYPNFVKSLVVVSTPHPKAFLRSLWRGNQALLSRYMLFFQLPILPERYLQRKSGKPFIKSLKSSGLSEQMAVKYVHQLIRDAGKLTNALNWYRAIPIETHDLLMIGSIGSPTLFIYGLDDSYLSSAAARLTSKWVFGKYTQLLIPGETHWIPEESPAELAKAIDKFVRGEEVNTWG